MNAPRPFRLVALTVLALPALGLALEAQDLVFLRDGGRLEGALTSCVGERCMLDGSPLERSAIAWIGLAPGEPAPPEASEGNPDELVLRDGSRQPARLVGVSLGAVVADRGSFDRREVAWVRLGSPDGEEPEPDGIPAVPPPPPPPPPQPPPPPPPPPTPAGAAIPGGPGCTGYTSLLGGDSCGFWIGTGTEVMEGQGGRHATTVAFRLVEAAFQECGGVRQVFLDSVGSFAKRDVFMDLGSGAHCSVDGASATLDERHAGVVFLNPGNGSLRLPRIVLAPGEGAYEVALSSSAEYTLRCQPSGGDPVPGGFGRVIAFPNPAWVLLGEDNRRMTGRDAVATGGGTIRTHWDLTRVEAPCDRPPALPSGGGLAPGDSPISLGDLFLPHKAEMRPTAEAALEGVASRLEAEPRSSVEVTVIVAGRADDLYADTLAQARFDQIATWLTERGIDPARITGADHGPGTGDDVIVRFE